MDESKLPKGVPAGIFDEIHLAARDRDADRVSALLTAGIDPNVRNSKCPNGDGGNTPLWFAAQGSRPGGVPVAQRLLAAGANIDAQCEYGTTPLHIAVAWSQIEMVQFLVAEGADANARSDNGRTPLESALADQREIESRKRAGRVSSEAEEWLAKVPVVIEFLSAREF